MLESSQPDGTFLTLLTRPALLPVHTVCPMFCPLPNSKLHLISHQSEMFGCIFLIRLIRFLKHVYVQCTVGTTDSTDFTLWSNLCTLARSMLGSAIQPFVQISNRMESVHRIKSFAARQNSQSHQQSIPD